ncbi:DNA-binding transcriptional response regulator, NtrC family, contains REC, AAA-type ATPase, and a Fis-type DNA-binding domains [Parapedobacter luteus]|uniref:DNA-binding transcriptional response regulator, NtrC family, contains REC, AAA-type ATPase, and a Fis-type DNA-binding domains n=1 Tax=Parapedobacter luteus TaxID=623280 RepID=A0A1T5DE74_9SPHI|nr:sigma-54 dependent transcriptional regulator [Parapedobacter luteus]SKB69995.1 DNA-binding transcriptional response regulator, NtrC family, contains REC, AAA-type ATPase, and a Fis-type DNA-binding domains [Parapedobacter luteus]
MKHSRILVVDDDPDVLTAVRLLLKQQAGKVITERNPEQIPSLLAKETPDLVLLDMNFKSTINTGNEGLYWLNRIKTIKPNLPVVMITAYGAIDLAVTSLKQGAADFVVKPWQNEQLIGVITGLLSKSDRKKAVEPNKAVMDAEFIGESEIMQDLLYKISKIAPTDANILVLGENGTGKDLIATAIHKQSRRADKPFVKVDVGALTESLFESELFGHKKGAFTDAREDRVGRFEAANGGTLFLDEIGNISLQQQAKLLSVLQNRQVIPLGSNTPIPVDIRLICATNVPLTDLANENRFRKDLIYRINTVDIQVPPLRDRGEDILRIARHFLQKYAQKYMKSIADLDKKAEQKLLKYHYPGNVRELQYSIERAVIMADTEILGAEDLIFSAIEQAPQNNQTQRQAPEEHNLVELERITIANVVEKHGGNISKAAKELGITRTALYRRLSKYDI